MSTSGSSDDETGSSDDETGRIELLVSRIFECGMQVPFDKNQWMSLKEQLAATPATNLAGVAAKLSVVHHEIQVDADQLDANILQSAITELRHVSKTGY